ncbi:hypothetical protein LWC35_34875 [Pseudonocardia kujensis]|uniref:hypothetical protein n=1 Tax=Pseudonocardia kujensis TaxID=1128675 RepID=UPI001E5C6024|nr:hypothetical protein [Pseudonocardia kujensis]MCE0768047.1 hypothetical protein [Pseudonocardia kujensis]
MSFSAGPLADTLTALGAAAAIAVLLLVAGAPLLVDLVGPRRRRLPGGAVGSLPVGPAVGSVAASPEGSAPRADVPVQGSGNTSAGVEVPAQAGPVDAEPAEPAAAPEQGRRTLTVRGAAREIGLPIQRTALAPVIPLQRRVSRFS